MQPNWLLVLLLLIASNSPLDEFSSSSGFQHLAGHFFLPEGWLPPRNPFFFLTPVFSFARLNVSFPSPFFMCIYQQFGICKAVPVCNLMSSDVWFLFGRADWMRSVRFWLWKLCPFFSFLFLNRVQIGCSGKFTDDALVFFAEFDINLSKLLRLRSCYGIRATVCWPWQNGGKIALWWFCRITCEILVTAITAGNGLEHMSNTEIWVHFCDLNQYCAQHTKTVCFLFLCFLRFSWHHTRQHQQFVNHYISWTSFSRSSNGGWFPCKCELVANQVATPLWKSQRKSLCKSLPADTLVAANCELCRKASVSLLVRRKRERVLFMETRF